MRKLLVLIIILFSVSAHAVETCPSPPELETFLDHENPRVIAYMQSLSISEPQEALLGLPLCDGKTLFKGWRFTGVASGLGQGQHVYLFTVGKAKRAVAWVERGAKPLTLPRCPAHLDCDNQPEGQNDIADEVFTFKKLSSGDGPIIILFPFRQWFLHNPSFKRDATRHLCQSLDVNPKHE